MSKETIDEFVFKVLTESKVDIDIEYCKKYGIKYTNHEEDASKKDLFDSKCNKAAFDLIFKNR